MSYTFDDHLEALAYLRAGMAETCDTIEAVGRQYRARLNHMNGLSPADEIAVMERQLKALGILCGHADLGVGLYKDRLILFEDYSAFENRAGRAAPPSRLDRKSARHRGLCHGHTPDGKPCLGPACRGTAFCYHHQHQAGPTVTAMADLVVELANTLPPREGR